MAIKETAGHLDLSDACLAFRPGAVCLRRGLASARCNQPEQPGAAPLAATYNVTSTADSGAGSCARRSVGQYQSWRGRHHSPSPRRPSRSRRPCPTSLKRFDVTGPGAGNLTISGGGVTRRRRSWRDGEISGLRFADSIAYRWCHLQRRRHCRSPTASLRQLHTETLGAIYNSGPAP